MLSFATQFKGNRRRRCIRSEQTFFLLGQGRKLHICRWISLLVDCRSSYLIRTNDEPVKQRKDNVDWGCSIDLFQMSSFNQNPDVIVPSLPSEAMKLVFGEGSRVLILALGPIKVCLGPWRSYSKLWWSYPMRRKHHWSLDVIEISDTWNPGSMLVSVTRMSQI